MISAENAERNQKQIQNITGACGALAQGSYTHHEIWLDRYRYK
jgi:hypothetical protein